MMPASTPASTCAIARAFSRSSSRNVAEGGLRLSFLDLPGKDQCGTAAAQQTHVHPTFGAAGVANLPPDLGLFDDFDRQSRALEDPGRRKFGTGTLAQQNMVGFQADVARDLRAVAVRLGGQRIRHGLRFDARHASDNGSRAEKIAGEEAAQEPPSGCNSDWVCSYSGPKHDLPGRIKPLSSRTAPEVSGPTR